MLNHYWLKMIPDYDTKMGRLQKKEFIKTNGMQMTPVKVYDGMKTEDQENEQALAQREEELEPFSLSVSDSRHASSGDDSDSDADW